MKKLISFSKIPNLKDPCLLAAWPGMGKVALTAVEYLINELDAEYCGEMANAAQVSKQVIIPPLVPENKFYYYHSPKLRNDIVFFVGSEQPMPHAEYMFAQELLNAVTLLGVKRIYTTAAAPSDMHFEDTPRVFAVPNNTDLLKELLQFKVHFMGDGTIAGLNGLLISVAREMNMDGICLLGEIPFFTVQMEFPRASHKILEILSKMLGLEIDMVDLELYAEEKMKEIEPLAKLLGKEKEEKEDEEPHPEEHVVPPKEDALPNSVRLRIEKLFQQAEFDRTYKSKMRLKEELDQWGIFDDYLDRFLDLFKKNKGES